MMRKSEIPTFLPVSVEMAEYFEKKGKGGGEYISRGFYGRVYFRCDKTIAEGIHRFDKRKVLPITVLSVDYFDNDSYEYNYLGTVKVKSGLTGKRGAKAREVLDAVSTVLNVGTELLKLFGK